MRFTRTLSAVAAAGIAVGALAGCSSDTSADDGGDGGNVELTVTWWGNESRIEKYEKSFEIFEEEHPGVEITGVPSDYSSYWTSRSTEGAARELPDLMQFDPNLAKYAKNGLLLDLTDYVGDTIDFTNVDENIVKGAQIDGVQYGVPFGIGTFALFVNKALVEKAGVEMLEPDYTWEELNAWISEITAAGVTNDEGQPVYGGNDHGAATQLFYQWLVQKGIEPWDGETPGFTQQDIVDYLSLEEEGLTNGAFYPIDRTTQVAPLDGFSMNESASSLTFASFYGRYAPEVGAENIVMLPVPSGASGEKAMWFAPSNYAIGANTEHPQEATELADFLARDARVAEIFGTDRGVMVDNETRAGFEPQDGTGDAEVLAYVDGVQEYATAVTPETPENFASYEAEWLRLNEERMYGNITAEQFAEQWWAEAGL